MKVVRVGFGLTTQNPYSENPYDYVRGYAEIEIEEGEDPEEAQQAAKVLVHHQVGLLSEEDVETAREIVKGGNALRNIMAQITDDRVDGYDEFE